MFEFLFKYTEAQWKSATLAFDGTVPVAILAIVVAILTALFFVAARRLVHLPVERAASLAVLQGCAIAVIAFLVADPHLVIESLAPAQNEIVLLLDDSASMSTEDSGDRFETARQALNANWQKSLASVLNVQRMTVSGGEVVMQFPETTKATTKTDLTQAIAAALARANSQPTAAIVIASDGLDTSGLEGSATDDQLQSSRIPVFAIPVGDAEIAADIGIRQLDIPATTLRDSSVDAQLTLAHGRGGNARVRVMNGNELLHAETVVLNPDQELTTVQLPINIGRPGVFDLEFQVEGSESDPHPANNQRTAVLRVREKQLRILYIEGEPRWEYKFIRRALNDDPVVEIVTHLQVSPNKYYRQGIMTADELANGFPDNAAELFQYDALIVGSVAAASLDETQHELIREFVSRRGGSLLLLAGPRGLSAGGWAETQVGEILPTRLPVYGTGAFQREHLNVEPTAAGYASDFLQLDEANRQAWASLPRVANHQSIGTLKTGARELLRVRGPEGAQPLLATTRYGRGQTFVLGTAGTWRWQMSLPSEDQRHETFWRALLRELVAGTPEQTSLNLVSTSNSALQIEAHFVTDEWFAPTEATASVELTDANGTVTEVQLAEVSGTPGQFRATVSDLAPGSYTAEARLETADGLRSTARGGGAIAATTSEDLRVRADRQWMERLAMRTGGAVILPEATNQLAGLIQNSETGLRSESRLPLWNMPAAFLLLLLLKTSEWLLRRRWGVI